MEDAKLIELFQQREESAIALTEAAYGRYCASIVRGILPTEQDVEEILSDTWLRIWNTIPPQVPKFLKFYAARIARNLAFDRYRSMHREKRGAGEVALALSELEGCIPSRFRVEERLEAEELKKLIHSFLESQPPRERSIFLRRFFFLEDAKSIALRFGMQEGNVRTVLTRMRKKLRAYLEKEAYYL